MANSRLSQRHRLSARALIVAAMLATGALAAPQLAPAMAQKPPAAPAGPSVNKQMAPLMNAALASLKTQNWPDAKAKLDAAYAVAKTPQEKLEVEKLRYAAADGAKDFPAKIAAIKASIATGALSAEDTKNFKNGLAAAYKEAGDTANYTAATKAYVDEYGATQQQYAGLATEARKAGDFAGAQGYLQKAIDAAKTANDASGIESYMRFSAATYVDSKEMDKYYATMGALVAAYPKDDYWRDMVGRAQREPGYAAAGKDIKMSVYRTELAVGMKLSADERAVIAGSALDANLPAEALAIYKPLFDSGEIGGASDAKADLRKKSLAEATSKSKLEEAGLAKEEKDFAAKGDAAYMAEVGEVLFTHAEYARSAALLKQALDKGIADPGKADITRLLLGMAQYKAGDKAAAKATLAAVKTENGSHGLAQIWLILASK